MASFVEILNQIRNGLNNTSSDTDPVDTDMDDEITLDSRHVKLFHAMLFTTGMIPIAVGVFMPFWNIFKRRRQSQQQQDREWVRTKIADPAREKYLLDLMKNYSKVLLESDVCDDDGGSCVESLEGGPFGKSRTTEICPKKPSSISKKPGDKNNHTDDGNDINDDNVNNTNDHDVEMQTPKRKLVAENRSKNDSPNDSNSSGCENDIEMQRSKTKLDVEDEEKEEVKTDDGGSIFSEYDNSLNHQRTIFVPLPGQKAKECQCDNVETTSCNCDSAETPTEAIETQQRHPQQQQQRTYSEGCVICLNPFEVNQRVTWSSNKECLHVFHHQCLLEWFDSVGKKAFKNQRIPQNLGTNNDVESIPSSSLSIIQKDICDFATQCPYCRQDYFLEGNRLSTDASEDRDYNNNAITATNNNDNTGTASSSGEGSEEEDIEQARNN